MSTPQRRCWPERSQPIGLKCSVAAAFEPSPQPAPGGDGAHVGARRRQGPHAEFPHLARAFGRTLVQKNAELEVLGNQVHQRGRRAKRGSYTPLGYDGDYETELHEGPGRPPDSPQPHRGSGPRNLADGQRGSLLHRRAHPDQCHQGRHRPGRVPAAGGPYQGLRHDGGAPGRSVKGQRAGQSGRTICQGLSSTGFELMQILAAITDSVRMAFFMFWDTLWPLIFGFGLSGAVQAFVSRSEMQRVMGDHRPKTLGIASVFGAASSSCSYAASAMAKSLFQKGADFTTAMVFMLASTNLVIELGLVLWILIGWQFALSEYVGGIIMIGLLAVLARYFFRPAVVERARAHLTERSAAAAVDDSIPDTSSAQSALARRLRSPAAWADAASYTMADLVMLRKEMIVGYVVAGFLAVLVPASLWNVIFFHGHGIATSIENVIVGPLIAILSFVCSIGNVPLAAALWKGGISFGGVVSFIFADLITFPLLLIYRKFYGWALTLRILAAFWPVMAAAGLATEYLFAGAGLVPVGRPAQVVQPSFQGNYTTYLNLVFLGVFGLLLWLYRNRERLGGGAGYAIDPVCGMQVERQLAPATAGSGGQTYFFCSDRCRDRFVADPDRFRAGDTGRFNDDEIRRPTMSQEIDPVCGMTVEPESAAAKTEYAGKTYYFCNPGCAKAFERKPEAFVDATRSA